MRVMRLNEEVQMFNSRCFTMQVEQCCQKPSEVPFDQLARSSELHGGSSEQTERNQKLPVARSTERAPVLVERCF